MIKTHAANIFLQLASIQTSGTTAAFDMWWGWICWLGAKGNRQTSHEGNIDIVICKRMTLCFL